jgi:DNA-binding PadR family transcriptional regulator
MYADNTLTPKEAIRLCALGTLAGGGMLYADLATEVRHFISRITGPSLELMAESIELLRYEGLVDAEGGEEHLDNAKVTITESGREVLQNLLVANLRPGNSDLNELIIALKFRFLHLLSDDDREHQMEILVEACETDLARLEDLRDHHAQDPGYLLDWLDHDIGRLKSRLAWLNDFRRRVHGRDASHTAA